MVNPPPVLSPVNPHFFQPLLPGFHTHFNIPVAFFSKHIEGRKRNEQKKAKLRSDGSDKTWIVKMDGRRFTNGWEDFAVAHDLRIGDVIVFRQEGEMVFHVTACGPSCCEIHYTSSQNIDEDNNKIKPMKKRAKKRSTKNPRREEKSSSDHSSFAGSVPPSSLHIDALYLPKGFVRSNGLNKGCCEMVLKNDYGGTWNLVLRHYRSNNTTVIARGWKSFCQVNGLKARDPFRFKLVGTGRKPILRLCPAESNPDTRLVEFSGGNEVNSLSTNPSSGEDSSETEESEEKSIEDEGKDVMISVKEESNLREYLKIDKWKYWPRPRASSSASEHRFVTLTITPYCIKSNKLRLPIRFTRVNDIKKQGKITLMGQDGVKWMVHIAKESRRGTMRLGRDWKGFCEVHGVKIGDSFLLELIREEDASPVLKFCTKLNRLCDSCY